MAAPINFGQVIAQSVGSSLDRIERAKNRALEIEQMMAERDLQQQIAMARQNFRQQQLDLQAEEMMATNQYRQAQLEQEQQNMMANTALRRGELALREQQEQRLAGQAEGQAELTGARTDLVNQRIKEIKARIDAMGEGEGQQMSLGDIVENLEVLGELRKNFSTERSVLQQTIENARGWFNDDESVIVPAQQQVGSIDSTLTGIDESIQALQSTLNNRFTQQPSSGDEITLDEETIQAYMTEEGVSREQAIADLRAALTGN